MFTETSTTTILQFSPDQHSGTVSCTIDVVVRGAGTIDPSGYKTQDR